jgi:hypothetical protein
MSLAKTKMLSKRMRNRRGFTKAEIMSPSTCFKKKFLRMYSNTKVVDLLHTDRQR